MLIKNNFILFIVKLVIIFNRSEAQNHWNLSQWWEENQDFDTTVSALEFKHLAHQSSELRAESTPDLLSSATNSFETIDSFESNVNRKQVIPKSSVESIKETIYQFFTRVRSHKGDKSYYKKVKRNLKEKFLEIGLTTATQSFWPSEMRKYSVRDKAHNIIGIWPGVHRGTSKDRIVIVGAHYDTVRASPGVDDNGSGSAAVLEVAKLIAQNRCKLESTLIFVLFDMEEDGLKGSKHFVKDYLIPVEVMKNGAKVLGAIIMDMILEHDMTRNSQSLGIIASVLPEWSTTVKENGYRGDFAAVWARKGVDTKLFNTLEKNWLNKHKYRLSLMAPVLPEFGSQIESNYDRVRKYETFMRSDHASFWYPTNKYITFPAVLITDLGPWRRNMRHSYHRSTDDTRNLSDENLAFVKNTVDSVVNTVLDLSNGKCFQYY